jgi:hypothetical protein
VAWSNFRYNANNGRATKCCSPINFFNNLFLPQYF